MKNYMHNFLHHLKVNVLKPEMSILPGQLAFYFVLTIIPLVALLGSIINIIHIPKGVLNIFYNSLPIQIANLIFQISTEERISINLIVFLVTSLILASNGTNSMIITSNHIYKMKNKGYFARRLKALFMLINLILLLVFMIIVLVFGDRIVDILSTLITNTKLLFYMKLIYRILKYPISLIWVYLSVKVIYIMAPDCDIKGRQVRFGAIFTTLTWVIATKVYSWYISNFAQYNSFYGSISSIIVLLLWIYILSYLFVLGMMLNAARYSLDIENKE